MMETLTEMLVGAPTKGHAETVKFTVFTMESSGDSAFHLLGLSELTVCSLDYRCGRQAAHLER
jgi:hypothetical protein